MMLNMHICASVLLGVCLVKCKPVSVQQPSQTVLDNTAASQDNIRVNIVKPLLNLDLEIIIDNDLTSIKVNSDTNEDTTSGLDYSGMQSGSGDGSISNDQTDDTEKNSSQVDGSEEQYAVKSLNYIDCENQMEQIRILSQYIAAISKNAFEYYCSNINSSISSCQQRAQQTIEKQQSDYLPALTKRLTSFTYEDVFQNINQGLLAYKAVIGNITALLEYDICGPYRLSSYPCNYNELCDDSSGEHRFFCRMTDLLDVTYSKLNSLQEIHINLMASSGLEPHHRESDVDIKPISCPDNRRCGAELDNYTLAGLYNNEFEANTISNYYMAYYQANCTF